MRAAPRHSPRSVALTLAFFALASVDCSTAYDPSPGSTAEPIKGGVIATTYPEAVYVTVGGIVPCSGVLLAPSVVLTAGHCGGSGATYDVVAPNANGQTAHASASWSPFTGDPSQSSDVRLVFLDTPIVIDRYPTLSSTTVAPGTKVVDIGRTLDGTVRENDYVSPPVTISGAATALGFPYNYEATPDISEAGDSGGPIEIQGSADHTVVAIVDTDTIEQNISAASPIDLFARLDLVYADIEAQIAARVTDGSAAVEGGGAADGGAAGGSSGGGGGGCAIGVARGRGAPTVLLAMGGALVLLRRRRRGGRLGSEER
jgi:hypothetical protein